MTCAPKCRPHEIRTRINPKARMQAARAVGREAMVAQEAKAVPGECEEVVQAEVE